MHGNKAAGSIRDVSNDGSFAASNRKIYWLDFKRHFKEEGSKEILDDRSLERSHIKSTDEKFCHNNYKKFGKQTSIKIRQGRELNANFQVLSWIDKCYNLFFMFLLLVSTCVLISKETDCKVNFSEVLRSFQSFHTSVKISHTKLLLRKSFSSFLFNGYWRMISVKQINVERKEEKKPELQITCS